MKKKIVGVFFFPSGPHLNALHTQIVSKQNKNVLIQNGITYQIIFT